MMDSKGIGCGGVGWIKFVHDIIQLQAHFNMEIKLRFLQKTGNFLSNMRLSAPLCNCLKYKIEHGSRRNKRIYIKKSYLHVNLPIILKIVTEWLSLSCN
jgi:hypothetical protein